MAQKTDAELTTEANVIGDETTPLANTADRVRDYLVNAIDSKVNNSVLRLTRTVTTADAITQADDNALIIFNSGSPIDFTLDQLTADTKASFINKGAGIVTFIAGSGVTITGDTTLSAAADPSYPTAIVFYQTLTTPLLVTGSGGGGGGGSGDVTKVGTPVNNQVGVWTGDGTIEGDAALTFDTSTDKLSTAALNLSGLTASLFVKTDASKNLETVAAATQAVMITGTNNTDPATSLSVESKRSILLTSFTNNATGSSTIDCGSKQEVTVLYTVTVTGAITIAVSNATNLEILHVIIPITGSNIGITTPSTTRMSRYSEVASGDGWYQSTKILQVSSVGTADLHELSFKRGSTGPIFILHYDGPVRA